MGEEKKYVISERQIDALRLELPKEIVDSLCSNPLSEEVGKAREYVLDEISKKLMDAMGIQSPPLQHYDPDDSFIPSLGADELADIVKSLRGE